MSFYAKMSEIAKKYEISLLVDNYHYNDQIKINVITFNNPKNIMILNDNNELITYVILVQYYFVNKYVKYESVIDTLNNNCVSGKNIRIALLNLKNFIYHCFNKDDNYHYKINDIITYIEFEYNNNDLNIFYSYPINRV